MSLREEQAEQRGANVRIGIVGCGAHASVSIFPALRGAPVELIAVCDLDPAKAAYNARKYGAERWYTDAGEMMDKEELEAVLLIGPAGVHYALAKEALGRGLHVWMEKPPGETAEQAFELMKLAERHNRQIQVGFMMRYATANQLAKEITERSEFGGARALYFRYMASPYPDRYTFYLYHAIHAFDLVQHFMGAPASVFARETTLRPGHFHLQVSIAFENGSIALLDLSCLQEWASPNVRLEVTGDGRHVVVDNSAEVTYYRNPPQRPTHANDNARFVEAVVPFNDQRDALTWQPNQNWATLYSYRGYEDELNAFASALLAGRPVSAGIDAGYRAMLLLAAIWKAVEEGKEVRLANISAANDREGNA